MHIWVSFCRTGKMSVKRHSFLKVEGLYGKTKRFWWLPAICTDLSWLVHASEVALDPSFQIKPLLGHPELDPFFKFYCYFNALVRPNLQRWTEFGLLIIFLVNFWWFSFFYFHSSPSLSRDMPNWSLAWNFHHFEKFSYRNTDCRSEKCLKRRPQKPCKAGQYKKVFILLSRHDGDKTIDIWLLKMIWGQKLHFWRRKWSFWTLGPINGAF